MARDRGIVAVTEGEPRVAEWGGMQGIAQAEERKELAKSTDMATTTWPTLRTDGLKIPSAAGRTCLLFPRYHSLGQENGRTGREHRGDRHYDHRI